MSTLLYRLGRFSFRRAWTVIGVWVLVLVGIIGGGIALGGQSQESYVIPGTESQEALDKLSAVFPQVAGASAQAVLVAPSGSSITDEDYAGVIDDMVTTMGRIDGVDSATGPFDQYAGNAVTDDERMARIQVQFEGASTDVTPTALADLVATRSIGEDAGLTVEFGGGVFQDNTFGITVTEALGVVIAGVVLLITFGSLVAAGLPLLGSLIGVGIVIGAITLVSAFTTVSSSAPLLALMIGLAVGIDYSLFILSRHRGQLAAGEDPQESAAISVGTAGSAVVFAGVTVIIALLGLLVVGIPFLSVMGVAAAFAVLVAIAVATTLLPATLGLLGARLTPKPGSRAARRAAAHDDPTAKPTMGLRWVGLVMRHPVMAVVGVVALLGTLAVPALQLDLSLPDNGSEPASSTQRKAYDLLSEGFGPGYNGPLVVAVDITQTTDILDDLDGIGDRLRDLDDVNYVSQGLPDAGLDTAIIQVIPASEPDAIETKALVQAIRDLAPAIDEEFGTPITVTGATAVGIDISNRLTAALIPFGIIVVGLSVLLLMMVFRSVLVPLKAAAGFLLSVLASFGVVVAVFQWGWLGDIVGVENPGPVLSFMPILLMAVLFGLAMDYEVFLVSGMREEFVHTGNARSAISRGFGNGARVVTAAALIMFFVFAAFVPEGSGTIKPIALGLAVGIAFDAFLVRMTLGPAIMTLLGRSAWWLPGWLARIVPDLDVEGVKLRAHLDEVRWADSTGEWAVTADRVVAVSSDRTVGPVSLAIPAGAIAVVTGDAADRRLLLATLAGRIELHSGRAHVLGSALPSERARVSRLVAFAGLDVAASSETLGDLLHERVRLTGSPRSWRRAEQDAARWVERVGAVIATTRGGAGRPVGAASVVATLPQLDRAIALAALALAEGTPVVVVDQAEPFASANDHARFLDSISRLAGPRVTIVWGTTSRAPAESGARAIVDIDLDAPVGQHPADRAVDQELVSVGSTRTPLANREGATP